MDALNDEEPPPEGRDDTEAQDDGGGDDDPVDLPRDDDDAHDDDAQGVADAAAAAHPQAQAEAEAPHGGPAPSLDRLPVRLLFEVGSIDMPLAAIRRLGPGSVIDLERPLPPAVIVRCRGAVLARGELVDLGGRLAVQITDLET